jgi:class 3 adenylate cyclase
MTAGQRIVLVVDDDPINRRLLERSLVADGFKVITAADGAQALDYLGETTPDIVLLDVLMPHVDGFGVLERIKAESRLREVPVIMISGLEDHDTAIRCIELGAEDYLPKPFDPVLLRARINAGLNKRRVHELEQARVRDVFARFLPKPIVDELLVRTNGEIRLGGVRLVCTVLFTDLRGFTSFAERTPPDRVIEVLNRFLGEMTDAVLDNGGTLVTYLGDGVLAVFGAPIAYDDHADRALAAAREMLRTRLPHFNDWLRGVEHDAFAMGIGLSSGPLMSGNVGSERRLSYTAIGDTVNTAARIEAHTKKVAHSALVSQSTRDLLTDASDLIYVDEITLRGRTSPTRLWALREPLVATAMPQE